MDIHKLRNLSRSLAVIPVGSRVFARIPFTRFCFTLLQRLFIKKLVYWKHGNIFDPRAQKCAVEILFGMASEKLRSTCLWGLQSSSFTNKCVFSVADNRGRNGENNWQD